MFKNHKALRNNILFFTLIAFIYTAGAIGGYVFGYLSSTEKFSTLELLSALAIGIFSAVATSAAIIDIYVLRKRT